MKKYISFYALIAVAITGCGHHDSNTASGNKDTVVISTVDPSTISEKGDTVIVKPGADKNLSQLNLQELQDDSVFSDGSKPSKWEIAGITDVLGCKLFIKKIQSLVVADNREALAACIRYPLNKTIKTPKDFLTRYDQLFTPKVKAVLNTVNFSQIFRNYQGVMLGGGEIWITQEGKLFKIIAVNN